ncbi:MAG: methionyl-tRNA formyltransferase [Dehalococcoidales bacterium]|nr:methionyl-tRNA formyltransferase [Dehalococcoidales bacterium]
MRVVFMGTPEFAIPPLEYLLLDRYEVAALYTQPDRPVGRGRSLSPPPIKRVAQTWQLPVAQPPNLKGAEVAEQLAAFHPDVIVVAAFGQILPPSILSIPPHQCLNIHPSLLPKFRGAAPVPAAILSGDEFTGVSIMLMEKGLDTGPVLTRAQVPIAPSDTTGTLMVKLSVIGAHLLLEVLPRWVRGEITPQPQSSAAATYSAPITKEAGEIDWQRPAAEIWRRVRAFQPWPGCFTRWRGKQLKILEAVPLPGSGDLKAGTVVALPPGAGQGAVCGVATGDGVLGLLKVQLEGRQALSIAEFRRGQRDFIGAVLPLS